MATQHELDILAKYSKPSLSRSELTRYGKQLNLMFGYRMKPAEIDEFLNKFYGEESNAPTN